MNIAIDVRELCGKPTGVGRYLFELLAEWAAGPERARHTWMLYAHEAPNVPAAFRDAVVVIPGAGGTRWEQWDLARQLTRVRPDVLFAPGYTAPLTAPCPIALTIHDVSFFDQPEEFRWREGLRRRRITAWAARRAKVVLTVSAFSRDRLVERIGVPASRVRVIHHGMRPSAVDAIATRPREPIALYVGSIFPRRHVDVLVRTFATEVAPRVPDARLEIIGEDRLPPGETLQDWLTALPAEVRGRVVARSWVDEATLRDLYARARVFVFLSEYEGFGLTPLEAIAAGVPPIVLDTPVAREVYGDAARFVGGDRPGRGTLPGRGTPPGRGQTPSRDLRTVENLPFSKLGIALVDLLTNDAARAALLARAPEVLARYQWDTAARLTLSAIEDAAQG